MLQILRKKAQSFVIQVIVVIIALVFIFWGVGTNLMNDREAALVINKEEISFQDFQVAYDRAYSNLRNQFGGDLPQGLLESFGIKEQVTDQLIQETLLRQGAEKMGIMVSRQEIQEAIEKMAQFQDNGSFSISRYKEILAINNYSPHKFEESMKTDLLLQKISLAISGFAGTVTDLEIEDLHKLEKSSVAVKYATFNPSDFAEGIEAGDEELSQWFATVQNDYMTPPQVKLKYLDFSYAAIAKKLTIDALTIENYYQEHLTEFTFPEQRRARHILFRADENSPADVQESQQKRAQEVLEMARNGSDFSELARQYSEDSTADQGGDLGLFSQGQMVKPFDDAVFSLNPGELSEVVKTNFGFHIISVDEIVPATTTPIAAVRDQILAKLQTEQARPMAFQVANTSYENIIAAGSLQAFLDSHPEVEIISTDYFDRNTPPDAVADDTRFLETAFSLKKGELSSLIETDKGYAILFADDVREPVVPDLAVVKDEVLQRYTTVKAEEAAGEKASAFLLQAQESGLAIAAEKTSLPVSESGYFDRNGQGSDQPLPGGVVAAAFKLSAREPLSPEPGLYDGQYYVLEFVGQKLPETPLTDEEKEQYRQTIIQFKQQQILAGWLKNQRESSKIFTHKSL